MEVLSVVDLVRKNIRNSIITGEFEPGMQLKEEELCKKYGISRPPIREAFKMLEADGLVIRKPRRGVYVSEFNEKDIWEIYTLVAALYRMGAILAIDAMNEKNVKKLSSFVDQMSKCAASKQFKLKKYQKAHREFHEFIIVLSGNERLKSLEANLRYQISLINYKSLQNAEHVKASLQYHQEIIEALENQEKEKTLALMEEHVMYALSFVLKTLPITK